MGQSSFTAQYKICKAWDNQILTEEERERFIDLIDTSKIQLNIVRKHITNDYDEVLQNIYDSAEVTKLSRFDIEKIEDKSLPKLDREIVEQKIALEKYTQYIEKTTCNREHSTIRLADITGQDIECPLKKDMMKYIVEDKYVRDLMATMHYLKSSSNQEHKEIAREAEKAILHILKHK